MTFWPKRSGFSDLLTKHHDLVLWDAYHHIKALLLYPCGCSNACSCAAFRKKIVLSLNLNLYLKAKKARRVPARLETTRLILNLPEPSFLEDHFCEAYPLWLMDKEIEKQAVALLGKI